MRKLGLYAGVRAIQPVMGAIFNRAHGESSKDMPPLRMIQDSGILWGFHTDTTEVKYRPFTTLGSIAPGKLADLVVMDRDYLTIPADQIKDIKPVITMVGGRVVYDAAVTTRGTR